MSYTPQTREKIVSCGDLDESEEYLIPVIFDLLLFGSEAAIGPPAGESFPIKYDDVSIVRSRKNGSGIQHEYLIRLSRHDWNDSKQSVYNKLQNLLTSEQ